MKLRLLFRLVAFFFAILYGTLLLVWYLTDRTLDFELILFIVLLLSTVGLILEKEWARKTVVFVSLVGVGYVLWDMIYLTRQMDILPLIFIGICILVICIYQYPQFKRYYQSGFLHPNWKILVVDDDKIFLKLIRTHFLRYGIYLLAAQTGEEGLQMASKKIPDLIILDVILPDMNGKEVCVQLKEDSRTKDIPVIFLTVKESPEELKAELEAGGILHFTKPVDFQELYLEIKKILGS